MTFHSLNGARRPSPPSSLVSSLEAFKVFGALKNTHRMLNLHISWSMREMCTSINGVIFVLVTKPFSWYRRRYSP